MDNMMIPYDRNEDIKIRGKDTLVYDHNDLNQFIYIITL